MLNKAIMYAKLAWVYAKGMCGLRRRVYDLQFVYVPEDKTWYIDMPWPGDRYNLAMVAGSNHLLTFLDYKGERRVRVMVKPSKKICLSRKPKATSCATNSSRVSSAVLLIG